MATVLRIKRKADGSPAETIVIAPKTAKTGRDDDSDFTFTYAGTFKNPNSKEANEAICRVKDLRTQLRTDPKDYNVDLPAKLREEHRSASKKNRLKLLFQHRSIIEEIHSKEVEDKDLESLDKTVNSFCRLYEVVAEDVQKERDTSHEGSSSNVVERGPAPQKSTVATQTSFPYPGKPLQSPTPRLNLQLPDETTEKASSITCNNVAMVLENVEPRELEEDFVYDVYYTPSDLNLSDTHDFSVFKCVAPEDFEPEAAYESDLGLDDDDSDSNAEDNWRNDYPDEEPDFEQQLDCYGDYSDDGGTDFMYDKLHNLCLDDDDLSTED